jgi:hypothetical protein
MFLEAGKSKSIAFGEGFLVLGYKAGHLLRGQRTLETKEVTR